MLPALVSCVVWCGVVYDNDARDAGWTGHTYGWDLLNRCITHTHTHTHTHTIFHLASHLFFFFFFFGGKSRLLLLLLLLLHSKERRKEGKKEKFERETQEERKGPHFVYIYRTQRLYFIVVPGVQCREMYLFNTLSNHCGAVRWVLANFLSLVVVVVVVVVVVGLVSPSLLSSSP